MKLGRERARNQPVGPFIEVPQNDAGTGYVNRAQQILIDEPYGLRSALAMGRAEMHIKDVQQAPVMRSNVRPQHATLLAPGYAEVHVASQSDLPSAERYVSVGRAAVLPRLADGEAISQTAGEIAGLVVLDRMAFMADDLLQGNDVRLNLFQHPRDSFNPDPAVEPAALVDVICGDSKANHLTTSITIVFR